MNHKTVEQYLLSFPDTWLDYPFGDSIAVYKVGDKSDADDPNTMFALIMEGKTPVRLSLKCDPQLAILLRQKYDEVMSGEHLSKKNWNTLVLTGQMEWEEVQGLIRHSYNLVTEKN
jgi:predicted DNA-binding protein (MmcQ/YjbR family)